ncbi:Rne/Rng family ribonuclease [Desulfohalovibrio reitneri]|uniref:Rne/Rng family ribonuclease n=1 Tax=Desulfohalovibrio reitneri TaxID=1307759 RepID=UPI0004A6E544|nr:Rne/Rng family ribonuclease [Desulfohalovibrio reitneri]
MTTGKKARRKMFLSVLPGEMVELVITEEGRIQEYYVEMLHQAKTKGNIYKGYIHNVDSSLQAAFVNYGADKNGFLQIDEVHPEYYQGKAQIPNRSRFPLIQNVLKPGQELLVQVVKEPTGTKGAFVTTYLSLPGRYFVLTPGRDQTGVSRKIDDEQERERLKELVEKLDPGEGLGLIVRTVSSGQSQKSLTKDVNYLKRLWKEVRKKGTEVKAPSLVYQDLELSARAVRDYLTPDVAEIWVDEKETGKQINQMVNLVFPRRKAMVKIHEDTDNTLWERFNLQKQLDEIYGRNVTLPSGGQLVIDQTEALTAIDINSGRIGGKKNFKEMALRLNTEAAEEIARQLRLRDLGGQFVVDFIEMKDKKHVAEVEKTMRQAMKGDRARTDVGRISRFGLMEIVRQRMGSSAISSNFEACPCCSGRGLRRNLEWQALKALKAIYTKLSGGKHNGELPFETNAELAAYLLNTKRAKLLEFEEEFGVSIRVVPAPSGPAPAGQ